MAELTRQQARDLEMQDEVAFNARRIFDFCIAREMGEKRAVYFAQSMIDFESFVWLYDKSEGNIKRLKKMVWNRLLKREINRISSTVHVEPPKEEE